MSKTIRPFFTLRWAPLALLALLLACSEGSDGRDGEAPDARGGDRRPNIVLIITNGQRADAVGFAPRPFLGMKTPHITQLAIEGTRFGNAFTPTAQSDLSRTSFLSGRYARAEDEDDMTDDALGFTGTLPEQLQAEGYESAYLGEPTLEGGERARPSGFDAWAVHTGEGEAGELLFDVGGNQRSVEGDYTERLTDMAVDWLGGRRPGHPFLLVVAHGGPAPPFEPDPERTGPYQELDIRYPPSVGLLGEKPAWVERGANGPDGLFGPLHGFRESHPDRSREGIAAFKQFVLAYAASVHAIDDSVGRIRAALEEIGVLDDTIFVLTSTHGFHLGEHGRIGAGTMYEASIRIPLVARFPRRLEAQTLIELPVLSIDLAPSLLDYASARPLPDVHGVSFVPLLEGRSEKWRSAWHYVYDAEPEASDTPTIRGIRTDRWKLIQYPALSDGTEGYRNELYDLQNDPVEVESLADEPRHTALRASLLGELAGLLDETDTHPRVEADSATQHLPGQMIPRAPGNGS